MMIYPSDDAVTEYSGISIIDASEANGEVLGENISNPASLRYMQPEFYRIGNRRCSPEPGEGQHVLRAH